MMVLIEGIQELKGFGDFESGLQHREHPFYCSAAARSFLPCCLSGAGVMFYLISDQAFVL